MAPTMGKLEGRITVPANWTLSLSDAGGGPWTVTMTPGTYYWSTAGSGANDFAAELKAVLDASASAGTYTVTISNAEGGTGKLTISVAGVANFSITWVTSDLRDVCGHVSNFISQTTVTGANQVQGLWMPDCGVDAPYGSADAGYQETDTVVTLSPTGLYRAYKYSERTMNSFAWHACAAAKVRTSAETTVNASFQTFWRDVIAARRSWATVGGPVRWYPDASTDGTYTTWAVVQPVNTFMPSRVRPDWTGLYEVALSRLVAQ